MKLSISTTPEAGKPKAAPSSNNSKEPLLKVRISGKEPSEIHPGVMEPTDWDDLAETCGQCSGSAVLEILNFPQWPDDARSNLLATVRDLDGKARLRIGGKTFGDPFMAILAAMQATPMMALAKTQQAAIEAAAVFCGGTPEMAAKLINNRLAEIGAVKINQLNLAKQIREMAGAAKTGSQLEAHGAAQAFRDHLAKAGKVDDEQAMLRYFQADFYTRGSNAWKRQEDRNFEAQLMNFLQTMEIPNLTERFSKDTIAHLRGMANLKCWDEPMPFLVVKEDPLEIERPRLIVFQNGMIDLEKAIAGQVKKPSKVDFRFFNEIVLPYEFNSQAKCPLWLATLKGILPKSGDGDNRQLVLQEAFGYCLLLDCRYEKCFILLGPGGNGKSTITRVWQAGLGLQNVSNVPLEDLGGEFRLESLRGKLANFAGEFPYLGKVHEGLLKQLVSGEDRDVNRKHKPPIKVRLFAKLICNTNQLPQINDPTEATFDRLVIMPFDVRLRGMKKEDKMRAATIIDTELPGVFMWALAGLRRLLTQGGFTKCARCQELVKEHRNHSDPVRAFVTDCCRIDPTWNTISLPLYEVYKEYACITGRKPVSDSEFGKRLKGMGWKKGRANDVKRSPMYQGVKLSMAGRDYADRWAYKEKRTLDFVYSAAKDKVL